MNYSETLKTLEDIVREVGEKHFTNVKDFTCSEKQDGSLVTEIDISVDASLSKKLKEVFPSVLFISEESQSDVAQTQGLVWCIDPIDGTHNFVNNIQYFAVSVGLLLNGAPLLGVIYDPTSGDILSGGSGIGVFLNKEDMLIENTSNIIVSGRSHSDSDKKREQLVINSILESNLKYRRFGSLALDLMNLVRGRIGAVRIIGNSIWDWSAGYAIAKEAGYVVNHHSDNNIIIHSASLSELVSVIK